MYFFLSLSYLFFIIFQAAAHESGIAIVPPIIWEKTSDIAIVGYEFRTHVAHIKNPCYPLEDFADLTYSQCRVEYEDKILSPFMKNCEQSDLDEMYFNQRKHLERFKRSFTEKVAAAVIISMGVLAVKSEFKQIFQTNSLKHLQQQTRDTFIKVRNEFEKNIQFEELTLNQMYDSWHALNNLNQKVELYNQRGLKSQIVDSSINRMAFALEDFFSGYKDGVVRESYYRLFPNISEYHDDPKLKFWKFNKCSKINDETIVFFFKIPIQQKHIEIYRSDPFRIVKNENNTHCFYDYTGTSYIVMNTETKCSHDLDETRTKRNEMMVVGEFRAPCNVHIDASNFWQKKFCREMVHTFEYNQIKQDDEFYYVYCLNQTLSIQNHSPFRCKNSVYKIPHKYWFQLDNEMIQAKKTLMNNDLTINSNTTLLLNKRAFISEYGNKSVLENLANLIKSQKEINNEIKPDLINIHTVGSSLIFLLIIIPSVIGFFLVYKKLKKTKKINMELRSRIKNSAQNESSNEEHESIERPKNYRELD